MELSSLSQVFWREGRPTNSFLATSVITALVLTTLSTLYLAQIMPGLNSSLNLALGSTSIGLAAASAIIPIALRILMPVKKELKLDNFEEISSQPQEPTAASEGKLEEADSDSSSEEIDLTISEQKLNEISSFIGQVKKLDNKQIEILNGYQLDIEKSIDTLSPYISRAKNPEEIDGVITRLKTLESDIQILFLKNEHRYYCLQDDGVYQIPDNGDCLFDSFRVFLQTKRGIFVTVQELRKQSVAWISENLKDQKLFYYLIQAASEHAEKKLLPMNEGEEKNKAAQEADEFVTYVNLIGIELASLREKDGQAVLEINKKGVEKYNDQLNSYLEDLLKPGVYGGCSELYALCHLYNLKLNQIDEKGNSVNGRYHYPFHPSSATDALSLRYLKSHYSPID